MAGPPAQLKGRTINTEELLVYIMVPLIVLIGTFLMTFFLVDNTHDDD